jgi:hypothetical protein
MVSIATLVALAAGAMVPILSNVAFAHQCLLPNPPNTPFPGSTPLAGNCPAGDNPLNDNQGTARGLIGQEQNNNPPTNDYCVEVLPTSACP